MSAEFEEHFFTSSLDGSREPYLLWLPATTPKALLVSLHTWSADRFNQIKMKASCEQRDWALLLPEFRGPNLTTNPRAQEAGGSALARRDIIDATEEVLKNHFPGGRPPVFLIGGSGGGHMALQVAGREAFHWDAVSSWCPITDVAAWQSQNPNYRPHIEAVCGGAPGSSPEVDEAYRERSPLFVADRLAKCRVQLGHGRGDLSVPYSHGWNMAQAIENYQPEAFFFTLFDGGHERLDHLAFPFFEQTLAARAGEELTG